MAELIWERKREKTAKKKKKNLFVSFPNQRLLFTVRCCLLVTLPQAARLPGRKSTVHIVEFLNLKTFFFTL